MIIIYRNIFTLLLKLSLIRCLLSILVVFLSINLSGCSTANITPRLEYLYGKNIELRKRVAVISFDSGIKELKGDASNLGKNIAYNLAQEKKIEVINYDNNFNIINYPYTINQITQLQTLKHELGAIIALAGTITDISIQHQFKGIYGFRKNVAFLVLEAQLNIINLENGIITAQKNFKQKIQLDDIQVEYIKNNTSTNFKQIIDKLQYELIGDATHWAINEINSTTWTSQVLEIGDKGIKISGGYLMGLSVGNTVSVYSLGERIKLNSGQELTIPGFLIGELQLVDVETHTSWAKPIGEEKNKNIFQPNQIVYVH